MRISKKRLAVLRKLESIVANSCYNANIQNWGPNGAFYGEGRSFRYPITFTHTDGQKRKGAHWYEFAFSRRANDRAVCIRGE